MSEFSARAKSIEQRGLRSQARLNHLTVILLVFVCVATGVGSVLSAVSAHKAADTSRDTQTIVRQGEDNRDRLESLLERIEALQQAEIAAGQDRADDSAKRSIQLREEINALRQELGLPPSSVASSQKAAGASGNSGASNSTRKPSSSGSVAPRPTSPPSKPTPQPAKPAQPAVPDDTGLIGGLLDGIGNIL